MVANLPPYASQQANWSDPVRFLTLMEPLTRVR